MFGTSNKTGVYRIRHTKSDQCYIGSCSDTRGGLRNRWNKHISDLVNHRHHSIKLQRAFNKYGFDAFVFEVLIYCEPQDCLWFEQIALDELSPRYNISKVAGSRRGTKQSTVTRDKIRKSQTGKRHTRKTKMKMSKQRQGMNAKLTVSQVRDIRRLSNLGQTQASLADQFGVSRSCIKDVVHRKTWRNV